MATLNITIDDLTHEQIVGILGGLSSNGHVEAAVEPAAKAVKAAAKPARGKAAAAAPAKTGKRTSRKVVEEEEEIIDDEEDEDEDEEDEEDEEAEEAEEDEDEEVVSTSEEELEEMSLPELRKFAKDQGLEVARGVKKPELIQAILDAGEEVEDDE